MQRVMKLINDPSTTVQRLLFTGKGNIDRFPCLLCSTKTVIPIVEPELQIDR
jgi:hypothetical protein